MKKIPLIAILAFFAQISFGQKVTYSTHVASIIYNNCTSCHRDGAIGPFKLESYQDAYRYRYAIAAAVQSTTMPPWSPDSKYTHFNNERKLTSNQINDIVKWVADGSQRGDSTTEPAKPVFNEKSMLINPEFSKRCEKFTLVGNTDDIRFFVLPTNLSQDAMIKQIEFIPGNRKVVHHIFLFIDSTGAFKKNIETSGNQFKGQYYGTPMSTVKLIGGYLPGSSYYSAPQQLCFRVPKNSYYILQVHYAPNNKGESDSTQLNIKYSSESASIPMNMTPLLDNSTNLINGPLFIPANTIKSYKEMCTLQTDMTIFSVTPHMHLIGKRLKAYAVETNGSSKDTIPLIDDHWNFHWQGIYSYVKPLILKKGTVLIAEGTFDNTSDNPDNPSSPPKDIAAGTSTLTEMMQVFFCHTNYAMTNYTAVNDPVPLQTMDCNIWPNPVGSGMEINLNLSNKDESAIALYCMDGKMVMNYGKRIGIENIRLSLPALKSGLYIMKINNNASVITKMITVE